MAGVIEINAEAETKNGVEIQLKKSSSKDGNVGYDIKVFNNGSITQERLDQIAEMSLKSALKCQEVLAGRGY